jgi:ABC-type transport system involved in multi-copper enzyme maturation permease subunit
VSSDARIYDHTYRRFTGRRAGVGAAVGAVVRYAFRRALGLRHARSVMVIPTITIVLAFLPAAAIAGLTVLVPAAPDIGREVYAGYVTSIGALITILAATAGSEALCPDRRSGALALYLASPLTRTTYLLGKTAATVSALCVITVGPVLILLVALTLSGRGPEGPAGVGLAALRVVAAGVAIAAVYGTISMAVSSFTDRRGVAAAAFILGLLAIQAMVQVVVLTAEASPAWQLLSPATVPAELVFRVHGLPGNLAGVGTASVVAATLGWVAAASAVGWARYRTVEVRR